MRSSRTFRKREEAGNSGTFARTSERSGPPGLIEPSTSTKQKVMKVPRAARLLAAAIFLPTLLATGCASPRMSRAATGTASTRT